MSARPGPGVAAIFVVAFAVFGLVGRATTIPGTHLATVWPAAGISVLWLLVRQARPLSIDTALLAVVTFLVNALTGAPGWLSFLLVVTNVVQTVVVVELMRRFLPELWGCGGTRAIDAPRRLARYLACVAVGTLVGTAVGVLGWDGLVRHDIDLVETCLWFGRNVGGILVVTTAGLLVLQYVSMPRPRPPLWDGGTGKEFVAACLTSATLYLLVFVYDVHSMLFLLLGVVIWFGVRFGTPTSSLHTLVVGHLAVAGTLGGDGPFAHVAPEEGALLVQLFIVATACTGLALSTGLDERASLVRDLRDTTTEATYQAGLLDAVVGSMAEGLLVVDDAGTWLFRNAAAARVGGLTGDLRTLLQAMPDSPDPLHLAFSGRAVRDMEIEVADPPGRGRIIAVSATPLARDAITGRARALLIFRDATVEHARRVDLMAFADVVAHDLRNPLTAIESWTEMMAAEMAEGDIDEDLVQRFVERVGVSGHRMATLIEDLLERATSNDSALQLRRVDVGAIAEEVATDHGADELVTVGEIPDVHADPALVRQVVDNLLANALKFVRQGAPARVSVTGRRTDSGTVAIAVTDEGIGLPPGAHEEVFDEHHRLHPTAYRGRGLGLTIVRRIVERHGGSIEARDNAAGRGAVFEFTLPSPD